MLCKKYKSFPRNGTNFLASKIGCYHCYETAQKLTFKWLTMRDQLAALGSGDRVSKALHVPPRNKSIQTG